MRAFAVLGLLLSLHTAAQARHLDVEVDFQYSGAALGSAELQALLASPGVQVEAGYQPARLVEGVTASRHRTMPFGSTLRADSQQVRLEGAQVERDGQRLRFRLPEIEKDGITHQLNTLWLVLPLAKGIARPQPLRVRLMEPVAPTGAHQAPVFWPAGAIELGLRLRYRWSDAQGPWQRQPPDRCDPHVSVQDDDHYRFQPRPPHAGYVQDLRSRIASDTTLLAQAPPPMEGWTLTRSQLGRYPPPGPPLEVVSFHAQQRGEGRCERSQSFALVFWAGRLVEYEHNNGLRSCPGEAPPVDVRARWDADGQLIAFSASTRGEREREWRAPDAAACQAPGQSSEAPAAEAVEALQSRARALREAFAPR